ncbi:Transcription-repair-coupling factor [uncultured Paludibacter sp.]|uniref:Transcription-repair-coupling factor n=1 Tax=uncultured Paludibacter sp. TaxID=497635 RepID=A0A653AL92_9BACT|nr:Transcription-repair-coupling factor [uncultured Paludibacter sp.]
MENLNLADFQKNVASHPQLKKCLDWAKSLERNLKISGLSGSSLSFIAASIFKEKPSTQVFVWNDADEAAYLYNDLKQILGDEQVMFFPSSYKKAIRLSQLDSSNEILRTEVLNRLSNNSNPCLIVTYPEAVLQRVVSASGVKSHTIKIRKGENISIDFLTEMLLSFGFHRVDFVYEPGQFSVRGGIVDIFSYSYELPYRLDFFGDEVESIRVFDIETQLSQSYKESIEILPDMHKGDDKHKLVSFPEFLSKETWFHFADALLVKEKINQLYNDALIKANTISKTADLFETHITGDEFLQLAEPFRKVEWGNRTHYKSAFSVEFNTAVQPVFHKNFDLVAENLKKYQQEGYKLYICSDSVKQTDRIAAVFNDRNDEIHFQPIKNTMHEGFVDHDLKLLCYTDHQIFDRFHKYQLKTDKTRQGKVVMTLKELNQLQMGDYVTHVDHGVGKFGGLVRTNVNGKMQEMVKLIYKDDDIIFVSIHSLHRISKYKGKEGEAPKINKLGSGAWERLKERTKSKVKDIARELIKLYAKRKAEKAYQYSPDSYLQQELEASFIYEDTPDQVKATADIKKDMEADMPMDRLVCGDVGFGKTEVAIRAAFKAVTDSKQVAVLVPTTVLAMQHYNTFKDRLKDFPCTVAYLSRAVSTQKTKEILEKLEKGEVDILIGTHKLVGKSVKFKDLGLLIIDEEQKFGVSVKEKLKELKANVDTLTLTATPIPRTLQFSLLGARDLSIINTPPPNRYPVQTEIHPFDEDVIREAIQLEMNRNGQVFFINNRIQNIYLMEAMIKRLVPGCRVAVGHGQMHADDLEEIIVDFIDYEYDVLVATTIVESGIDIPNVNTIIINSAHKFGLSDLHQLRGRVGRSNRKAYCYLLSPEMSLLTPEARRRLQAVETFSELGSGFNIAMQDLDIRGAGNMLGAEQSGFIADLGYETYQRILNEAVHELKDEEFAELYADERTENKGNTAYVTDCQIDTDMELMFSDEYIENVSERISLYRELDNIENEVDLIEFQKNLEDRFGKIHKKGLGLMLIVRLRWLAMRYGVEKLVLKNGQMIAFLVSNLNSPYYQSDEFGKLLQYMASHPRTTKLREQNGKRSVVFMDVKTVEEAWSIFGGL